MAQTNLSAPRWPARGPRTRERELRTSAPGISGEKGMTKRNAGPALPFQAGLERGRGAYPALHPGKEGHNKDVGSLVPAA